jgi:two-component system KDP operon response regulator KdpE
MGANPMIPAAKRRVLLVEDDPRLEGWVVRSLAALACEVTVAVHYEEVTRHLLERAPHLAIVSLNLPRNSGYDVCELIRGTPSLAAVQILITSERSSPDAIAFAEEAGANAFLHKPFSPEQLAKYARALLEPQLAGRPSMRWLRRSSFPPPA